MSGMYSVPVLLASSEGELQEAIAKTATAGMRYWKIFFMRLIRRIEVIS